MKGENRFIQPLKAESSVLLIIDYQPQIAEAGLPDRGTVRQMCTASGHYATARSANKEVNR